VPNRLQQQQIHYQVPTTPETYIKLKTSDYLPSE